MCRERRGLTCRTAGESDEGKARIADGSVAAISVDTAVFDRYGCNLDHAVLARLDQFKKGGVNLILSEVVVKEVTSHIALAASETKRKLASALKRHDRRWVLGKDLDALRKELQVDIDPAVAAAKQVADNGEIRWQPAGDNPD